MKKIIFCILFFTFSINARAQTDVVGNGGNWTEADLKHFLNRLTTYLGSEEGRDVFPEVVAYNREHPHETVERIAFELNPRIVNKDVFDSKNNKRDCVSYSKPVRYFECSSKALGSKPDESETLLRKSEHYGSLYRLVLHEVFVQAGIEQPLSVEVPSSYAISSRLMVHLEEFPEWVPGSGKNSHQNRVPVVMAGGPELKFGLGVGNVLDSTLFGPQIKLQFPINFGSHEFKFGFTTGFYGDFKKYERWMIPMLLTSEYDFQQIGKFKPYIGAGLGLTLMHSSAEEHYSLGGYTEKVTDTGFGLSFNVTPGFDLGTHEQFYFEVPITFTTSSNLSVVPTIGFKF